MKESIIGRTNEIERIDRCMGESSAQLIIVYGRRRVGKTFLINEYFDGITIEDLMKTDAADNYVI